MTVACYYCDIEISNNQAKRCSRCRIVTYCSKECQSLSWKATHKVNCTLNSTVAALNNTKPDKFSQDWVQLEVDKIMTKWMADWRRSFMQWTILALDLANHPPNRVVTHCLHIITEPRYGQTKSYKKCSIVNAAVIPFSQIQEKYPHLVTAIDTTDFTCFRYVVTLQSAESEPWRVRILQWSVRNPSFWNKVPKDQCAVLAKSVNQILMSSVEDTAPDIVEQHLGLCR